MQTLGAGGYVKTFQEFAGVLGLGSGAAKEAVHYYKASIEGGVSKTLREGLVGVSGLKSDVKSQRKL
jgi:hypothetical protein